MDDSFGTWLQQQRMWCRLSQVELAERAGCSVAMLRKLEANRRRPSKELLRCLFKALTIPETEWIALEYRARYLPTPTESLPDTRPPIRALLPTPLTSYIGRDADVDAVQTLLHRPEVRLLTLTGAPGVGKTRLSLAVATGLHDHLRDGCSVIPLSQLTAADLVLPTIAQHLGVIARPGTSMTDSLIAFLQLRQLLLVLDNFEHVLPAAAQLLPLLTHAPQVRLLITSREPLQVYGEYHYRVAPLAVTGSTTDGTLAPAIQLFVDRAQAVGTHLDRTPTTLALVDTLCRALDGLPLALELAAAQTKWFTLPELHTQLQQRLDLLVHELQDREPRQQSMRRAIAWSYTSLPPELKDVLVRLVAFRGGWTVASATAVCSGGQTAAIIRRALQRLVEKHLVEYARRDGQEPRYTLLESIREYLLEEARTAGLEDQIHAAHATYVTALVAAQPPMDRVEYSRVVAQEYANIQAALGWLARHDPGQGAYLVTLVHSWWISTSRYQEAGYWYTLFGNLRDHLTPHMIASMLRGLAVTQNHSGNIVGAQTLLVESFDLARQTDDPLLLANVANELGGTYLDQGKYAEAEHWYRESLAYHTAGGSTTGIATTLNNLGVIAVWKGDWAAALDAFERSDAIQSTASNLGGRAVALLNQGGILRHMGNHAAATEKLREAQRYAAVQGRTRVLSDILHERALLYVLGNQPDHAYAAVMEGLRIAEACGYVSGLLYGLDVAALIWTAWGECERAIQLYAAVTALREQYTLVRDPLDEPHMTALGHTLQAQGDPADYERAWQRGMAFTLSEAMAEALPAHSACEHHSREGSP